MKVKIIKASHNILWYANKIGEFFEAELNDSSDSYFDDYGFYTQNNYGRRAYFKTEDVRIVEDSKQILPIPESTLEWLQARQKELQDYVIQCMEHGDEIRKDITQEYCRNQQRILEIEKC